MALAQQKRRRISDAKFRKMIRRSHPVDRFASILSRFAGETKGVLDLSVIVEFGVMRGLKVYGHFKTSPTTAINSRLESKKLPPIAFEDWEGRISRYSDDDFSTYDGVWQIGPWSGRMPRKKR